MLKIGHVEVTIFWPPNIRVKASHMCAMGTPFPQTPLQKLLKVTYAASKLTILTFTSFIGPTGVPTCFEKTGITTQ